MSNYYASQSPAPRGKLRRNTHNRWIAGVCSGLADFTGLSPNVMRLLFALSCLLPGPQFIFYIVAWIAIPRA